MNLVYNYELFKISLNCLDQLNNLLFLANGGSNNPIYYNSGLYSNNIMCYHMLTLKIKCNTMAFVLGILNTNRLDVTQYLYGYCYAFIINKNKKVIIYLSLVIRNQQHTWPKYTLFDLIKYMQGTKLALVCFILLSFTSGFLL